MGGDVGGMLSAWKGTTQKNDAIRGFVAIGDFSVRETNLQGERQI